MKNSVPTKTTCPYCGVGCGVSVQGTAARQAVIAGDVSHPANRGRLCSKGSMLGETIGLERRLLHPRFDGKRVGWDEALGEMAKRFSETIERHGPDAVAFYVSGQLLTEDYYVANKLMKGFIGSGNIDTNSRLCMSSAVAGHKRAFGEDIVPGCYEDFEQADLVVLVGSNTAWCHPILYRRLLESREERGTRIVVIDPRRTATCDDADLHLAIAPGADLDLFNILLRELHARGAMDHAFVENHTEELQNALDVISAGAPTVAETSVACGIAPEDLETFIRWFAETERTITLFSQGINQSEKGVDQVNAIINCHLLTGRIGRPGMGPFSMTGQPNAMGGREVGGLAGQLAAHLEFSNEACNLLSRFWKTDRLTRKPGRKAVDMFDAMADGKIKAVWIMATNPAVSLPNSNRVRAALERCDFVVLSDCVEGTDTGAYADMLLPAAAWGEKDGTVTNSERRISRQRAFLDLPGEAQPDWWIVTQLARRLGFEDAFPYENAADIFREHAALSAFENDGSRVFDIGALAGISDDEYEALRPVQWPLGADGAGAARLFGDGVFPAAGGKAKFVGASSQVVSGDPAFPLVLNSGRLRDQWHTMTRTGLSVTLSANEPEPFVEIHPDDARARNIGEGHLVRLETGQGDAITRARIIPEGRRGALFMPIHWSDMNSAAGTVGRLVHALTDPLSGQPAFKNTPVRLSPLEPLWQAFCLTRHEIDASGFDYWARRKVQDGYLYELAGLFGEERIPELGVLAGSSAADDEEIEMRDGRRGSFRQARLRQGRLECCLLVSRDVCLPARDWLAGLLAADILDDETRRALLSGRPASGVGQGPVVCACMGVRADTIVDAIAEHALTNVKEVGECTGAGTNCGSCRADIRKLIDERQREEAA
ncbi:molybdopterin-dependent oxidoreductase [uncultured Parvibaculum sp.]|uniref:molybdopterin-dependent oxidoreductase n=1 Tax=uncultured Parvibaculum sp. TaxID=291828 RepID=UPI0030DBF60F